MRAGRSTAKVRIDRLSPADVTQLAVDTGAAPMNIAAVLVLADGADDTSLADLLVRRSLAVSRLRHRLLRPPPGCGGPLWVDAPHHAPEQHVTRRVLAGGGTRAVLDEAALLACTPFDRSRPLWAATVFTGWDEDGGRAALVLVAHHVVVDGLGGLEVLALLADPGRPAPDVEPLPAPSTLQLAHAAGADRIRHVLGAPRAVARTARGLRELGVRHDRPRPAAVTSLNAPTGRARRLWVTEVALDAVLDRAHRLGGTLNDVVVAAVVGGLAGLLGDRGEHADEIVVSVPVTARTGAGDRMGNHTGVMPVAVPTGLTADATVAAVTARTASHRGAGRGASAAPLGVWFRAMARVGLFGRFVDRQRMIHTFETNMRGPAQRLAFGGHQVETIVPIAVNPGNVSVSFATLSYAGRLVVVVIADLRLAAAGEALAARIGRLLVPGTPG
ncbi:MAG: DUF1298 domain-containing protein [Actinobacteria bacterium]|nr:DUF1298 domain-containing protein [Actinomycetota bacterium]MCG2802289.1 WS/DGAT domain-containing protein [Cellulomonas sp.]